MKRDMNVLRGLLTAIEKDGQGDRAAFLVAEPRATEHIPLAIESGLLSGVEFGGGSRKHYPVASLQLTPAGHDFVDLARNDLIWDRVILRIQERTDSTSLAVLLALLDAEHRETLS